MGKGEEDGEGLWPSPSPPDPGSAVVQWRGHHSPQFWQTCEVRVGGMRSLFACFPPALSSFIKEENVLSQNCLPSQTSQLLLARTELPVRPWVQGRLGEGVHFGILCF